MPKRYSYEFFCLNCGERVDRAFPPFALWGVEYPVYPCKACGFGATEEEFMSNLERMKEQVRKPAVAEWPRFRPWKKRWRKLEAGA